MQYIKFSVNLGPGRSGLLSRYVKATLASLSRWENYGVPRTGHFRSLPFCFVLFGAVWFCCSPVCHPSGICARLSGAHTSHHRRQDFSNFWCPLIV